MSIGASVTTGCYRGRYVPTAFGHHMGGATTQGDKNPRYYELQYRNAIAVMIKDVPARGFCCATCTRSSGTSYSGSLTACALGC
jgi:hypothetical protein